MSDIADKLEVKRHRTFAENLTDAAKSLKKITGYEGSLEDRKVAREYFTHYTFKAVTAHGLSGQGVSISYIINPEKLSQAQESRAPRATSVGGCAPASSSYKW